LADLLAAVKKTDAEVISGTTARKAESTSDGVKVRVRTKSKERMLEARKVIAADGLDSRIVDSLGLNQNRPEVHHGDKGVTLNIPIGCMKFLPFCSLLDIKY